MSIIAAFDKVLFYNSASKYSVLRLKTADIMIPSEARSQYKFYDHLIRFVAVGYDLPQTDAVSFELEGTWETGNHGCQLQVNSWKEIIPPTLEGIRGYLSSGLLKGIGEKTADEIVKRFGSNALDVIENHPERLLEIRGITKEKLEDIKSGYDESKVMRNLMTILAPFKVTPATAMKIYQHFGPDGVSLIRESPFRLCQMPGFGFKRVDAIVQKSGGDLKDPMRVQGALFYTLEQSRSHAGHLYMESTSLIQKSLLLLNAPISVPEMRFNPQQVEIELGNMIRSDVVVSNKGNIYLPHVFKQESETACKAVKMLLELTERIDLAPVMERVKEKLGVKMSKGQSDGVEMVFQSNLSIITGGPGTGKSTVLKAVIEAYRMLYPRHKILLAAPTGKASRRMAEATGIETAQTIHSLLGLHGDGDWQKKKPLEVDFLIIDEVSMLDMWLAHQLFSRLQPNTKLLLVGDVDQLESVGAGNVFQELIQSELVPVTVLTEIFRQAKDSLVAYNARFINEGSSELYYGPDFAFIRADSQEDVAITIRDLYQQELQQTSMEQIQVLSPFRSEGDASANELNELIRDAVNPAAEDVPEIIFGGKIFRLHDRVIQTKNNYNIELVDANGQKKAVGVFNGDIGTICRIQRDILTVNYDGRYAEYEKGGLDELELSYAMTIHKSEGSEYDTVIIPMLAAHKVLLTRNLLYTAITRAKRKVLLVGQKKALFMAIHTLRKGKRNTLLGERMRLYYQAQVCQGLPEAVPKETELKKVS